MGSLFVSLMTTRNHTSDRDLIRLAEARLISSTRLAIEANSLKEKEKVKLRENCQRTPV